MSSSFVKSNLAEDATTLTRVRNRFSMATDQQLPKIMTGLLPKLLQRLEDYSGATKKHLEDLDVYRGGVAAWDSVSLPHLRKVQDDIFGILATALERIRGNANISTDTLMKALLPFVGSKNALVGTWALAFLQTAISRTSAQSLDSSMVAILVEALGDLNASLFAVTDALETSEDQTIPDATIQALELRWIQVTWLLIDCIMILSGYKPLIDWDADQFDPKKLSRDESLETSFYKNAREETAKVLSSRGGAAAVAVTSLLLDLIIFWPDESSHEMSTLSPLANKRMNYRSTITPPTEEYDNDHHFAPLQRQRRVHPGLPLRFWQPGPVANWSDMTKLYLRHVKLAFLKFAIWPPNQCVLRNQNEDVAHVLGICASNFDSMHGRVAMDYLNHRDTNKQPVPTPVTISTIILILGEEASRETLQRFQSVHDTGCWLDVLGSVANRRQLRRLALPPEFSTQVARYLIKNETQWSDSPSTMGSNGVTPYASLAVALCLELCQRGDSDSKLLSMRLVGRWFKTLPMRSEDTSLKILEIVVEILSTVVRSGLADLNEMKVASYRESLRTAGGLAATDQRYHLDRLINTHRQSLKRKKMNRDDAVDARKQAYHLVTLMPSCVFERIGAEPYKLPNLLLQCAVFEDQDLEYFVIKAVDSVLTFYVEKLMDQKTGYDYTDDVTLQMQATLLLPSLLETICSDVAYARNIGMEWIKRLLLQMDPEAAMYMASHLVHDEHGTIARTAQEVVAASATFVRDIEMVAKVTFYDFRDAEQALTLRYMMEERIEELSRSLGMSTQICEKLLLKYSFSVSAVLAAIVDDFEGVLKDCGLELSATEKTMSDVIVCGICYDEVEATNKYSLRCGHQFCSLCWFSYVTDASESKFSFLDTRCPEHNCRVSLLRCDVQAISAASLSKWDQYLLESFVELDPSLRYCPGADCRCVAAVNQLSSFSKSVTCDSCRTSFCFACGERPHDPATCDDFLAWKRLKESSRLWLKNHSKPCPGCQVPIEKNGGCNHVNCSSCHADFCWLCLGLLNEHLESHICNRYNPIDSAEDDFERHALFTATRFEAHDNAEDFAFEQLKKFQPLKLLEALWFLEEEDLETLKRGLDTLVRARCFLKHSYIASLGLRNDQEALKKHDKQHSCLEMFTERLSQLTEMNLHRLYQEQGVKGLKGHFQRLAFFATSVSKYQQRMSTVGRKSMVE
jgi:ariadne-1